MTWTFSSLCLQERDRGGVSVQAHHQEHLADAQGLGLSINVCQWRFPTALACNGLPTGTNILPAGTRGPHAPVFHPILLLQPALRPRRTGPRYSASPPGLLFPYSSSATRHDPIASPLCRRSCLDELSTARLRVGEASVKSSRSKMTGGRDGRFALSEEEALDWKRRPMSDGETLPGLP